MKFHTIVLLVIVALCLALLGFGLYMAIGGDEIKAENMKIEIEFDGSRFKCLEYVGSRGDTNFYIVYDTDTGVKYIFGFGYCSCSISPLYDENGEIDIYEEEDNGNSL